MSAVPAPDTGPDAGAVWHYGDPLGEQRAAADGRRRRGPLAPGRDRPDRRRPQHLAAQHLHPARQRPPRRRGHPESEPRRPGPCRRSLGPDGARRRHVPRHRAVARRTAAGLSAQDGLLVRRRRRARRPGGVVAARPAAGGPAGARGAGRGFAAGRSDRGRAARAAVSCAGCRAPASRSTWWCPATRPPHGASDSSRPGCARRASGPTRRTGSPRCGPGSASTPTSARSRTRSAGSAPQCIWTRAAIAARKPSRASITWANRPGCWSCCTSTGPRTGRRPAIRCWPADATVGRLGTVVDHVDEGPIALALLKRGLPADTRTDHRRRVDGGRRHRRRLDAAARCHRRRTARRGTAARRRALDAAHAG